MSKKEKINELNQYKQLLISLKQLDKTESLKTNEKQKILVMTRIYNGKPYRIA